MIAASNVSPLEITAGLQIFADYILQKVLHATQSLEKTLKNVRMLLKPWVTIFNFSFDLANCEL